MARQQNQLQLDVINGKDGVLVLVSLRCRTRPNIITRGTVSVNETNLKHRVSVLAGALAEQHAQRYADPTDPDEVARAAESVFPQLGIPG